MKKSFEIKHVALVYGRMNELQTRTTVEHLRDVISFVDKLQAGVFQRLNENAGERLVG
jgi:hypothetical protein